MDRTDRLVTVELRSGLGNRLFQLAAGAWYASRHSRHLVVYDDYMRATVHDVHDNEVLMQMTGLESRPMPMGLKLKSLSGSYEDLCVPESEAPESVAPQCILLKGYFQDARFSEALRPYLSKFLAQDRPLRRQNTFLHVRFPDRSLFGTTGNMHALNMESYYTRAIQNMTLGHVEVYSNGSYAAVHEHIQKFKFKSYQIMPKMSPKDTLESMMTCGSGIISNSTFSWWAAQMLQWSWPDADIRVPSPWTRINIFSGLITKIAPVHAQPIRLLNGWTSVGHDTWTLSLNELLIVLFLVYACIYWASRRLT